MLPTWLALEIENVMWWIINTVHAAEQKVDCVWSDLLSWPAKCEIEDSQYTITFLDVRAQTVVFGELKEGKPISASIKGYDVFQDRWWEIRLDEWEGKAFLKYAAYRVAAEKGELKAVCRVRFIKERRAIRGP